MEENKRLIPVTDCQWCDALFKYLSEYTLWSVKEMKESRLTLEQAADSILDMLADHASSFPEGEGKSRIRAFGKTLTKAVQSYHPKPQW